MSFRWLIAAALIALPPAVSAKENAGSSSSPFAFNSTIAGQKPKGLPEDSYFEPGPMSRGPNGETIFSPDDLGRPNWLTIGGNRVTSDFLIFDSKLNTTTVKGAVTVDAQGLRIVTDEARYLNRPDIHHLDVGRVRMGRPPVMVSAGALGYDIVAKGKVETASDAKAGSKVAADRVIIYFNEPDMLVLSASASRISYDATGAGHLEADDVVFRFGPVPVFYLPSYSQDGLDGPAITPVEVQVGSNNRYGPYMRTTTLYRASKAIQPGLLLDGYGKAGVLVGPAIRYDTSKFVKDDDISSYTKMKGEFYAGFIQDHSDRGTDQFGQAIPQDRYFIDWRHKQTIDDKVEVTASIHAWSDPFATRDFRRQLFDREQQPDNFVEVVYPDRDFYASAFARFQPNSWQDINQRLPEIRLEMNPREISDTRIYQRGYVSVGYVSETTSDELPVLPGTTADTLASPRIDAYYGLTRPVKPDSSFTFTPVAGVRSTTWFDAINGDPTYSRLAGQLGFDAQVEGEGKWDYVNDVWELNGLRHKVRPVIQYRYLPGAIEGADRIPDIDRWTFLTAPPPIDLSQRRDTDELHETQILRLGLENLFQTRDKQYGSRNLVGFDVYQDVRETNREGDRTLSDTYLRETLTPAPWLDWQIYERVSPYTGAVHQVSTLATIADGDRWKFSLGYEYATDVPMLDPTALAAGIYQYGPNAQFNQFIIGWEYRINAQYRFRSQWRIDLDNGALAEQTYALSQQLGHSWQIEYVFGDNRNARGDSGVNFGVRLRLNTF